MKSVRTTSVLFTALVVSALVLTACAPSAAPRPSATVTAEAEPTPTPTPTETAYSNTDPRTWTINFFGFGPFVLETPLEDAVKVFPPNATVCDDNALFVGALSGWDVDIAAGQSGSDDLIDSVSVLATLGETTNSTPKTAEGIGVGTTIAELLAAYPGIELVEDDDESYYELEGEDGNYMAFYEGEILDKIAIITVSDESGFKTKEDYCD